jgi:dTDP-glucose 4,6-dehydratase
MADVTHRAARLLVTGGAGFIGTSYVRATNAGDDDTYVVTLDALTYAGRRENLDDLARPERHLFVEGDIADAALVARILREHRIDTIVHFAAESHVDRSIDAPAAFIRTNVVGTLTLLEAARDYWLGDEAARPHDVRFHHVSTDEVYGSLSPTDPPAVETSRYAPSSPYAASKAGADHLVRAFHRTYGLPVTISHSSNNYGPYQHAEKLVPTVIRAASSGARIPVYGDGSNRRDWLYVDDHVRAIDEIVRSGAVGETYDVGAGNERANLEVVRAIAAIIDEMSPHGAPHERLVDFVADRPGHDWRYAVDSSKVRRDLGWAPRVTFDGGLRRTIEWYMQRRAPP